LAAFSNRTRTCKLLRRLQLLIAALLALAVGVVVIAGFWRMHLWVHTAFG
jgi:hypothetical protein